MAKGHKAMLGVTVEQELIKELDIFRGEVPRSRVVERALNQYLSANTIKNLEGSRISSPASQPAVSEAAIPTIPTTTTDTTSIPKAGRLRDMSTYGVTGERQHQEMLASNGKL